MNVNFKKTALITGIAIVLIVSGLVANRYYYGSFNFYSHPVRLIYGGFHYNHRSYQTLSENEKSRVEVSRFIDIITGKRLFSTNKDFIGPGKTIYLQLDGDKVIAYSSGGGG